MSTPAPGSPASPWWAAAVGYEVYLRSFADGDGDGVGDLHGLAAHLSHLAWLGVDFIWITPFYPSPMADHGYDITDHKAVDPTYGTLEDLDWVIAEAHRLGLRVLIDLVPNHTSDQHPWFVASRRSRDVPQRGWYHWLEGSGGESPPNNWVSYFGGSAWSHDPLTGQWWCHLFLPEQPDLNWAEPAVVEAFDDILRFWLDRGVDGFRIDVAQGIAKDPSYTDNPPSTAPPRGSGPRAEFAAQRHVHDIGRPESREVFRRWRAIASEHDAALLGEVYLEDPAEVAPYVAVGGLDLAFTFAFAHLSWDADAVSSALKATAAHLGAAACWTQSSHDEPRPPTRFGGGDRGRARSLAVSTLLAGMPGAFVIFQGEELGLEDGAVPTEALRDPLGDRDGCRTPMPWSPGPGWGFTSAQTPWMPFGGRRPEDTVAVQRDDPRSPLNRMRSLLAARRALEPNAAVEWVSDAEPVVAYQRGDLVVAAAVSDDEQRFDAGPGRWQVLYSTHGGVSHAAVDMPCRLRPAEAVILVQLARGGAR